MNLITLQKSWLSAKKRWNSKEHQEKVKMYKHGYHEIDTYLWGWQPPEVPGGYDPSGFVIQTCTSYCAYKIFEETGKWPQPKTRDYDTSACNWQRFLREAGYPNEVRNLMIGHHYVGIHGAWYTRDGIGHVVWTEGPENEATHTINVSTYRGFKHHFEEVKIRDYIWIMID